MGSPGHDSVPLSGKRILLIGKFSTSKKELQEIITDLGGKNWRRNCNLPPTDLILAHATTVQQERKVETEVDQIEKKKVQSLRLILLSGYSISGIGKTVRNTTSSH
jgi:hypothetical protein